MLEDEPDAPGAGLGRAPRRIGVTVEQHAAGIGTHEPIDQFHERRLAGPVLAEEGVNLAATDGEAHLVVGKHSGKALCYVVQREQSLSACGRGRSVRAGHPVVCRARAAVALKPCLSHSRQPTREITGLVPGASVPPSRTR
jgi:hypothetical protein